MSRKMWRWFFYGMSGCCMGAVFPVIIAFIITSCVDDDWFAETMALILQPFMWIFFLGMTCMETANSL